MPGQILQGAALATAGIRSNFANMYKVAYKAASDRLANCMEAAVPSDKLEEIYGYAESAPYPQRWPRGTTIQSKGFNARQFRVANKDWMAKVEYHLNDIADDLTGTLLDQARMAGTHYGSLLERIFFQLLQSTVDDRLLDVLPNAPDGLPLYSSSTRFGVSGGNVESTLGVATPIAIRTAFFSAIARIARFQDTESQPLWDDSVLDQGYTFIYGVHNWQNVASAFRQTLSVAGALTSTSNAAISNIVLESGIKVTMWATQRITDDKMYVFLNGSPRKAIFQQLRQPIREVIADMNTSDQARATKISYVQWDSREGYGILLPYQTVQIA